MEVLEGYPIPIKKEAFQLLIVNIMINVIAPINITLVMK